MILLKITTNQKQYFYVNRENKLKLHSAYTLNKFTHYSLQSMSHNSQTFKVLSIRSFNSTFAAFKIEYKRTSIFINIYTITVFCNCRQNMKIDQITHEHEENNLDFRNKNEVNIHVPHTFFNGNSHML